MASAWKLTCISRSPPSKTICIYECYECSFYSWSFYSWLNNRDAAVCKVKNMQTKKTVCTWKGKYDTANNQTTNTFRILQKSIVSIQAAQAVIKHSDVSTTTMETTATQGLVLRYGMRFWPAPKYSMCSVSRT